LFFKINFLKICQPYVIDISKNKHKTKKNKRIIYDLFQLKQKMELKMAKKSRKGKKKKANNTKKALKKT